MDENPKTPPSASYVPMVVFGDRGHERAADIFSMLLAKRIIFIQSEIEPYMAAAVVGQLIYLDFEDPDKEICMYIQSPGGQITSGLAIVDTMRFIKSPIRTVCVGQCASMASWILAAGTKGRRTILPNAEVMIHQPIGGVRGQATDIEIANTHMQATKRRMNELFAAFTGKSIEEVRRDTDRDNYLTAEQAKEYGIVDQIIPWSVPILGS